MAAKSECQHSETYLSRTDDGMQEFCTECGLELEGSPDEQPSYEPPFGLPRHMSPSQVNSLMTCGEQYRLQKIERVPSRPMWAGVGGTTVHKVTEILDREWYEQQNNA